MTVCRSSCSVDCKSYDLPLGVCYSPPLLFPGDPQWGAGDVLDQCDAAAGILTRTLYSSSGGTCRGGGSPVQVPLDVCVGPFGPPRPSGSFQCLDTPGGEPRCGSPDPHLPISPRI
eukprot:CAMPEP_0202756294 /NCGR_PEP_ID=MMETSP1388-20130828/15602_1 /ASSEMBLY_ACC=CAM_ASM_000864 /TAXON_ID=37098 /ORGANISM="Isochrysis sp, Strain CCMP1244" /LENGTH=115 /DNA_ID=CAMNT_0049424145 /DNA_START=11 /DNA_END=355 /DNA_ORIENTATION=+